MPRPLTAIFFKQRLPFFYLIQDIMGTNLLSKFYEDQKINVASRVENCPAPWRPYINETNVLTKFHDDWANIVTSRVFTRNTAMSPGGHLHEDWASNVTSSHYPVSNSVEFHEDRTINVASRVFTRQNVDAARRTTHKRRSQSSP
ncbi:hypothetical protein DPMN_068707 [Dreissena polymorpha]|uniref:Uncharacterized protein n=1 Tax=Dreissena polymorpha TaxID=45954 RepID=A0A9D3YXP4_DREPO|nr:hypothetical protein DPMN_068707 [Dreissena polymorpha]